MSGKQIAIFGLSGNPPTGEEGHRGIVKYLVATELFDAVYVLPVYHHQFAEKKLETYEDRCRMCEKSMRELSTYKCEVKVMLIEKIVNELCGGNHGTVDTLEYIKQEYPQFCLHLIVGGDAFNDICAGRWKNSERLFELACLHVIARKGIPLKTKLNHQYIDKCTIHRVSFLGDVSSTVVRSLLAYPYWPLPVENNRLKHALHESVYEYIKTLEIYNFSRKKILACARSRLALGGMVLLAAISHVWKLL